MNAIDNIKTIPKNVGIKKLSLNDFDINSVDKTTAVKNPIISFFIVI